MSRKNDRMPHRIKSRNVWIYCIVIAILTGVVLFNARNSVPQKQESFTVSDAAFQVHVMDVGQGDSILVLSDGHAMLIDAAETQASAKILTYLETQGVTALDYAVATHLHADHIGSFPQVLEQVTAAHIMEAPCRDDLLPTSGTYEAYLDAVEVSGAEYSIVQAGERFQLGGASVEVLAPASEEAESLNNTSLVLKICYEDVVCLFTGDMENSEEAELLAGGYDLKADFLKVGHHGSNTASGEAFLARVQPEFAAISCSADNAYGHPAKETLDKLAAYTEHVCITAEDGDIVFVYDADTKEKRIVTGGSEEN